MTRKLIGNLLVLVVGVLLAAYGVSRLAEDTAIMVEAHITRPQMAEAK